MAARQNARAAQLEELKQLAPTRQEKAEIEALKATIEKVREHWPFLCDNFGFKGSGAVVGLRVLCAGARSVSVVGR